MDLETFIITIYVFVDDWYREQEIANRKEKRGRPPKMSDSEVLTLAIINQWQAGTVWDSERGLVRYMHQHGLDLFPNMLQRSAFNRRVRYLWGVLVELQQYLVDRLQTTTDSYECVDLLPIPAGTTGQLSRDKGHWLWNSTVGRGAQGWFWGDHLLMSVTSSGIITGWLLGAAHINERWLMEAFLSTRWGHTQLVDPPDRKRYGKQAHIAPPVGFIGGFRAVGRYSAKPYLTDKGFNGKRWGEHWQSRYHARVINVPPDNSKLQMTWSRSLKKWLASHRQIIETTFAGLTQCFGIKQLKAHSRWGQYTRIAAKTVAYNLGIYLNQLLSRPLLSFGTLLNG